MSDLMKLQSNTDTQATAFEMLMKAIGSSLTPVMQQLLNSDPSLVHFKGWHGMTALHRACLIGDYNTILMLIQANSDVNALTDFNETPLLYACKRGIPTVVHLLIQCGAQVNTKDKRRRGALHHAAENGAVSVFRYFEDAFEADTRELDSNLTSPLHLACTFGHLELFLYLLQKERSDVGQEDSEGNLPLHITARAGYGHMTWSMLCILGASALKKRNKAGYTPLDLVLQGDGHGHKELAPVLRYYSNKPESTKVGGPIFTWYYLLLYPSTLYAILVLILQKLSSHQYLIILVGLLQMSLQHKGLNYRMADVSRNFWYEGMVTGAEKASQLRTLHLVFQTVKKLCSGMKVTLTPTRMLKVTLTPNRVLKVTLTPTRVLKVTPTPTRVLKVTLTSTRMLKVTLTLTRVLTPTRALKVTLTPTRVLKVTLTPTRVLKVTLTPTRVLKVTLTPTRVLKVTLTPTRVLKVTLTPTRVLKVTLTPTRVLKVTLTPTRTLKILDISAAAFPKIGFYVTWDIRHQYSMPEWCSFVWPNPIFVGFFYGGILHTTICYCWLIFPYMYTNLLVFALTVTCCPLLHFTFYKIVRKSAGAVRSSAVDSTTGKSLTLVDLCMMRNPPYKYCSFCDIITSMYTKHCKLCNQCFYKLDHHCLYLLRCVAVDNHALFVWLLILAFINMVFYALSFCLYVYILYSDMGFWDIVSELMHRQAWPTSIFFLNITSAVWSATLVNSQYDVVTSGLTTFFNNNKMAEYKLTTRQKMNNFLNFLLSKPLPYKNPNSPFENMDASPVVHEV